jgi:hypothetical protein
LIGIIHPSKDLKNTFEESHDYFMKTQFDQNGSLLCLAERSAWYNTNHPTFTLIMLLVQSSPP